MSPLYTGPMNPYLFSLTSLALLGLSYVTYHHFRGDHTGPASGNLTTLKPAIIVKEVEDAIEVIMPKALLPEEDTMSRTLPNIPTVNYSSITDPAIPKAFDAREAWPKCSSVIGKVWDQGACQSCWAVSAAAVMTDRLCITSQAAPSPLLSPQHLICSCTNCTSRNANLPLAMPRCQGGDSEAAWQFWVQEGLVSGGDFGTNQSCLPYLTKPCLHNPAMPPILQVVPALLSCSLLPEVYKCPDTCANSVGKVADEKKYKGSSFYYINNRTEDIQREIMLNGPVQAKFMFEEKSLRDFSGKGLYTVPERAGEPKHLHSVKIIGWNQTEKGDSYWLCVNSYGTRWGDGGLFRIKRGVNMYLIEESVMAGIPLQDAEVTTVSS